MKRMMLAIAIALTIGCGDTDEPIGPQPSPKPKVLVSSAKVADQRNRDAEAKGEACHVCEPCDEDALHGYWVSRGPDVHNTAKWEYACTGGLNWRKHARCVREACEAL